MGLVPSFGHARWVGTQSFGDAWWGWYSACMRIWGCPLESVPGMHESLGMCLGIGTQNLPKDAQAGEHHPVHRQLRGPRGGKSAFRFAPPCSAGKFSFSLASPSPS